MKITPLTNGDVARVAGYGRLLGITPKKHKAALKKLRISEAELLEINLRMARFIVKNGRRGLRELSKSGVIA